LVDGATHVSATCPFPDVPATSVGASGTVAGVTPVDAVEYTPVPTVLMAATLKKYGVPFVSPVAVQDGVVEFVGQLAAFR
jgi:hypothetical protein